MEGDHQRSTEQEQLEMEKDGDRTGSEGEEDSVIEDEDEDNPDRGKSKEVIFLSPTNFDSAHMPRSVKSSVMINAKSTAQSLRIKINRSLGKCDEQVEILKELEQSMISSEQSNSDDKEEFCEAQTELIVAFDKIQIWNE